MIEKKYVTRGKIIAIGNARETPIRDWLVRYTKSPSPAPKMIDTARKGIEVRGMLNPVG
jgi:hypothetical protein